MFVGITRIPQPPYSDPDFVETFKELKEAQEVFYSLNFTEYKDSRYYELEKWDFVTKRQENVLELLRCLEFREERGDPLVPLSHLYRKRFCNSLEISVYIADSDEMLKKIIKAESILGMHIGQSGALDNQEDKIKLLRMVYFLISGIFLI